jgi:hypothetical protein
VEVHWRKKFSSKREEDFAQEEKVLVVDRVTEIQYERRWFGGSLRRWF